MGYASAISVVLLLFVYLISKVIRRVLTPKE
jgi:ABC-type sugar transport system permease subunit